MRKELQQLDLPLAPISFDPHPQVLLKQQITPSSDCYAIGIIMWWVCASSTWLLAWCSSWGETSNDVLACSLGLQLCRAQEQP